MAEEMKDLDPRFVLPFLPRPLPIPRARERKDIVGVKKSISRTIREHLPQEYGVSPYLSQFGNGSLIRDHDVREFAVS